MGNITEPLTEDEIRPNELARGQIEAFERDIERLQRRKAEFVDVPCPACDSSDRKCELTKYQFTYCSCLDCGTLYMTPRPSPVVMADYYQNSENYEYWAKYIFPASESSRREKLYRPWVRKVVDYCDRFDIRRRRLVEIGAGFGTYCEVAAESNAFNEVLAVEPTPAMAQACRERGVRVVEKRVEELGNTMSGIADVAVAFEVIEHLFRPREFLEQCSTILKTEGLLVVSCPNGQGFDVITLRDASQAIDPEHVNLFNPDSLTRLVESCGYQVREICTPGRLDAELVRKAVQDGSFNVSDNALYKRIFVDEWERLGASFQEFLAQNRLSSHMWMAATKQ